MSNLKLFFTAFRVRDSNLINLALYYWLVWNLKCGSTARDSFVSSPSKTMLCWSRSVPCRCDSCKAQESSYYSLMYIQCDREAIGESMQAGHQAQRCSRHCPLSTPLSISPYCFLVVRPLFVKLIGIVLHSVHYNVGNTSYSCFCLGVSALCNWSQRGHRVCGKSTHLRLLSFRKNYIYLKTNFWIIV